MLSLKYPSHLISAGKPGAPSAGNAFRPYHIIGGVGEDCTLRNVAVILTDSYGVAGVGVVVELRSEQYTYVGITDSDGIVRFPEVANYEYTLTVAKSGVNQESMPFYFETPEMYVLYDQVPKTIWDGMFADTNPLLYVDSWDGGAA